MKNLLRSAALIAAFAACEKDPIEIPMPEEMMVVTPKDNNDGMDSATSSNTIDSGVSSPTVVTGTETPTTDIKDEGEGSGEVFPEGSGVFIADNPAQYLGLIYDSSHDDGKGNVNHIYLKDPNYDNGRIIAVGLTDASGNYTIQTLLWEDGAAGVGIPDTSTVETFVGSFTTIEHRGIEMVIQDNVISTGLTDTLDRALDLVGDNWSSRRIFYIATHGSYTFYSGLANGTEFIIAGNVGVQTLIHEDGHNYDSQNPAFGEAINPFFNIASQVSTYAATAISEYRAEVYAYYYASRGNLPTVLVNVLDALFD